MPKKILNIGILASVDAGKTTITENMLYLSGITRQLGQVDKGTTVTDNLPLERQRGISIKSAITAFNWQECQVNLIDTPGHVDFTAEVERALSVLDGVILVISAPDGIQGQTEMLWHSISSLKIPTIIFINKIDRIGSNTDDLLDTIRREMTPNLFPLQTVCDEETENVSLASDWHSEKMALPLMELLAERHENLLDYFLETDTLPFDQAQQVRDTLVQKAQLYPVLFGAAKFSIGISELLDTTITALCPPVSSPDAKLSARIFKAEYHKQLGRVLYARIYHGSLEARQTLQPSDSPDSESDKIAQVWTLNQGRFENTGSAGPGEIAMLTGLRHFEIGHLLGQPGKDMKSVHLAAPLLAVQVIPSGPADLPALLAALNQLADENPHLNLEWDAEMREVHIKIMGNIQLEILEATLQERFGLSVSFGKPAVIYKETPAQPAEGFESYTMPKPCWAIVRFQIEPAATGSGIHFESDVGINQIAQRYQHEIARSLPEALKQGPKGWEVTDIRIRLVEGEHHTVHSRPGDFKIATAMALMKALTSGETRLLEPRLQFSLTAPEENLGTILGDLTRMRAEFLSPDIQNGRFKLTGQIPLASSLDYPVTLSIKTGGMGKWFSRFDGYAPCPESSDLYRDYRGVNPLDRSKFILQARKAL